MSVIGLVKNIVVEGENDNLTLSQTTHFRQIQHCENTVGKGQFARYEQFILFPHCFQKTFNADT